MTEGTEASESRLNGGLCGKKVKPTKEDFIIGHWLSAALDDPQVCDEMKKDIEAWFASKDYHA